MTARLDRAFFVVLLLLGLGAGFAAAVSLKNVGVAWDTPLDVQAAIETRMIPPGVSKDEAYASVFSTSELYGVLLVQGTDALRSLLTNASSWMSPQDLDTYRWLGAVTLAIALAGAAATGWATGVATHSRIAGAFTWALLMSTPLFIGMSLINIKDVPVAAGMSMFSSGLVLSVASKLPQIRWAAGLSLTALGAVVSMGARAGIWPVLCMLGAGTLIAYGVWLVRRRRLDKLVPAIVATVSAGLASLAVLWLTNPFAKIDLARWLFDAFTIMRGFAPWDFSVRMNGGDFATSDLPWWYVPAWIAAQGPVLTILAGLAAASLIAIALIRSSSWLPRRQLVIMVPFFIQGVALPAAIVLTGSTVYDGLRHLLFMVPGLVALMGLGVASAERAVVARSSRKPTAGGAKSWLVGAAAVTVVTASLWATIRWLPYSYAFVNPVAGWDSTRTNWDLDFWGVTAVEGVERLQNLGFNTIAVEPAQITSTMVGAVGTDIARQSSPDEFGLYVFKRFDASLGECELLFQIQKDRQILGEGGRCR